MKIVLFTCCLFIFSIGHTQKFVHLKQNALQDSTGKTVKLNAVNLGGWLLWEGWILGSGFIKESDIKDGLQKLLGDAAYSDFLKAFYQSFITKKDITLIAQNGFNCIRLPFNYRLLDTATNGGIDGFAIIDKMVDWCQQNKIYLVLDMHAAPGGQSNYFIADPAGTPLWKSEENQDKAIAIWKIIATRYKDENVIAGYDLLNEPNADKSADLIAFYNKLVSGIRSVDANHLLLIEGNKLAHQFKDFPESLDANSVYSFHYYPWFNENNKSKALKEIVQTIPGNRPIWCGEWGEDNPKNLTEAKALLNAMPNVCGTAFWTWKRTYKNNGRLPLYTIQTGGNWDRLATWLTYKLIKPKQDVIEKGIAEFLNGIVIENCLKNNVVQEAIF